MSESYETTDGGGEGFANVGQIECFICEALFVPTAAQKKMLLEGAERFNPDDWICPDCDRLWVRETWRVFSIAGVDPYTTESTTEISINCVTEPDIDSEEWEDWFSGHWSTPYIDWLPLTQAVLVWLKKNYRFEMKGEGRGMSEK